MRLFEPLRQFWMLLNSCPACIPHTFEGILRAALHSSPTQLHIGLTSLLGFRIIQVDSGSVCCAQNSACGTFI